MIVDNIKNRAIYETCTKGLKEGFDFILKAVAEGLPLGKYEIEGENIYAIVQEYNTKPIEECKYEAHRKYIDIQYVVKGKETITTAYLENCKTSCQYNAEKDVEFFEIPKNVSELFLNSGDFAIFFPQDVHCPQVSPDGKNEVLSKIVVKVKV